MFMLIVILVGVHRPDLARSTVVIINVAACGWGSDRHLRFVRLCWNFMGNYGTLTPMEDGAVRVKLHFILRCTPRSHALLWMPSVRFFESPRLHLCPPTPSSSSLSANTMAIPMTCLSLPGSSRGSIKKRRCFDGWKAGREYPFSIRAHRPATRLDLVGQNDTKGQDDNLIFMSLDR